VKLLIVAGPYEADRIRRAAVSAGIEAVAVEPGESLSGWITATRPEVIVLAPQVINPDPAVALSKIRAVPRGRVPILLVGEAADEATLRPLGDGFFVRPIAADDLIAQARAAMGAVPRAMDDGGSGPQRGDGERGSGPLTVSPGSGSTGRRALRPLVADRESGPLAIPAQEASEGAVPGPAADGDSARARSRRVPQALERLAETIDAGIDADMDADLAAELRDVVRAVDERAAAQSGRVESDGNGKTSTLSMEALAAAIGAGEAEHEALAELTDESSQKTRELARAGKSAGDEMPLDPPSLLARMYLSRLSGRLTLRSGAIRKHIVFDEGHPALAGSTQPGDRLGEMLTRQGRLDAEQASSLGDEAAASGRRLGQLLVERGLLPASELTSVVRRHYQELIHSLFAWERGAWTLGTDGSLADEQKNEIIRLSQHPSALILTGVRRDYGAPRALASLGGAEAVLQLRPSAGLGELLEKMELDAQERRSVLLFDGWRNLAAVAEAAGLSLDTVGTLAWTLLLLERLEPAPLVEAQEGGGAAPHPTTDRDEAIDRALVQARHALILDGDYFQVLGVSRDASAAELRRARDALLAGVNPAVLHPAVAAGMRAELEEIRAVLDEAVGLLEDDRVRQLYREHLPGTMSAADSPPAQ